MENPFVVIISVLVHIICLKEYCQKTLKLILLLFRDF